MPRKSKQISADELAQEGRKIRAKRSKREQRNKQQAEESGLKHRRDRDQRRIFLHITSWTDWKGLFLLFTFLSISSLLPFLIMWMSMPSTSAFETSDFVLLMSAWSVFWIGCFWFAKKQIRKKVLQEKNWIENLPFELIAYPDVLVYRSYPSIYFTIEFERKQPELPYLLDVLASSPHKILSKVEFELIESEDDEEIIPPISLFDLEDEEEQEITELPSNATDVVFKFEMTNDRASKFNRHRRWARHWVHEVCNVHFQAIHAKYPIKSIMLNDGTNELDFEWWIPRKKKWWQVF